MMPQMPHSYMYNPSYGNNNFASMKASPAPGMKGDDTKNKDQLRDYLRTMFYPFQND